MTQVAEGWAIPWLSILGEWSIRWGLVIAALAVWLRLRPPRRAATRHLLCLSAMAAGVLLPVSPRWGHAVLSWPARPGPAIGPPPAAEVPAATEFVPPPAIESPPSPLPIRPIDPTPRPGSPSVWEVTAMVAAVAWGAVALALLIRLAGGWRTLARLRRGAVGADPDSGRLLDECRSALGLSRPVGIAMHPAVASPAVVGGWRPLVLVPDDWGGWPELQRRACLLHELAHLSRYDDWARLVQEVVRAPFFFHPMVGWLLARLDREREILCDEAAVAMGSDPLEYARLLLELARRPGRLRPAAARPGWLPFLDRRTVAVRIARLLEDDMTSNLSRPSIGRSLLVAGLAVGAALVLGGLRVRAGSDAVAGPSGQAAAPAPPAPEKAPEELRGVVLDPDGRPVPGATVVAGVRDERWSAGQFVTTDAQGRFQWRFPPRADRVEFLVYKEGFGLANVVRGSRESADRFQFEVRLRKAEPLSAVVVDQAGKPLAGATVRAELLAEAFERGNRSGISYNHLRREIVGGSPIERLLVTTTDASGEFTFRVTGPDSGLKLLVTTADGRTFRIQPRSGVAGRMRSMMEDEGFTTAPPGQTIRLVAVSAARVSGRVATSLPGVRVSGMTASYQPTRAHGRRLWMTNFGDQVPVDAEGRFTFDGLYEGTINVFVHGDGENNDWTYRAAADVKLTPGATSEVTIELIRGVKVEGTIVAQGTGAPVEGAQVGVYGPFRPRTGAMTTGAMTDARGHYHYRLPAGDTYFYVMGPPKGFTRLADDGSSRNVTIAEAASSYVVPPIEVAPAVTVRGRVVDATGAAIAGATVVGTCEGGACRPFDGDETVTDVRGEFRLPPGLNNTVAVGRPARLLIRLKGGAEHEVATLPANDGVALVMVPVAGEMTRKVEGPRDVAPDELAGVVVDADGKPIGGAEVDAWTWYPGHEAKTDARGEFRIGRLDKDRKVEVIVRKDGYTPQLFLMQPTGQPGWVIVLGRKTYFEGRVTGPDGRPVAGARIRANCGPKQAEGVRITEIWTEATTDEAGRYRMYAQADVYDIQVGVPGVGVARLSGAGLKPDEAKRLDIKLERGVTFRARVVDSLTDHPVPGVRLWNWQHAGVEGRSQEDGIITIPDMMPGPFQFQVEARGYTRWWSDDASTEWSRNRLEILLFLDFLLKPDMEPVTITVEPGVTVSGRVVDPDGKPVAGATVAPALTGTGNSLTGDTRFSVRTDRDGRFQVLLPASGAREYNLVAHDGKYQQWRNWANGVLPPIRTKPGEVLRDVEIRLTRPASARGRVVDAQGRPVARREVRASAADRRENRYYDPTTTTAADGTYELKFIRPGEQFIQVAPFWLDARLAPGGTSHTVMLNPGESKDGVDFRLPPSVVD